MRVNRKILIIFAVFFLMIEAAVVSFDGKWIQGPDFVFAADGEKPVPAEDAQKGADNKEGGEKTQPCPECPECPDVAKVVLRGLEEKKQSIASAEKELGQQKKELETYEAQIDEKLTQLTAIKNQIKEDMARLEEKKTQKEIEKEAAFESKMARLVKMYAGMKPKSAALIVDKMELEVAQEIFLRMREASASQILSFVDAAKAAKISERLAYKKK